MFGALLHRLGFGNLLVEHFSIHNITFLYCEINISKDNQNNQRSDNHAKSKSSVSQLGNVQRKMGKSIFKISVKDSQNVHNVVYM